jgi:hypothetical protein
MQGSVSITVKAWIAEQRRKASIWGVRASMGLSGGDRAALVEGRGIRKVAREVGVVVSVVQRVKAVGQMA